MNKNKEQGQDLNKGLTAVSKCGKTLSRRTFIKKAAVGGIAIASAAGIIKAAKTLAEAEAEKREYAAYVHDELQQDKIMKDKKYVLMTKEEKEEMLKMFADNYKYEQA
ncbi:MAG: twin-arginine translocation signal domain-containing protein [Deltaproteobacteria bacterium]|nr:twin-arginine translocation signal domain-containing protein [Deltaproteobacteria bacterium]